MEEMQKIKPYSRKIAYYETDQMGVVHHSNYIRWMEEARLDFFEQAGLPYSEIEKRGIIIPVLSASCKYQYAMRFGQRFEVTMRFPAFTGVKFHVLYEIRNPETGKLHATGESSHGFVSRDMIPIRLKKEHPDVYEIMSKYVEE